MGAAVVVALGGALAYAAAYELFADVPGGHYARVRFEPAFSARADAPTLSAAFMLAAGAAAVAAAVATAVAAVRGRSRRAVAAGWVIQGAAVVFAVASWLWGVIDFFNNAGEFG